MEIGKKQKLIYKKENGRGHVEIYRHKDPIMDNIIILNGVNGNTKFDNTWVIEKDLPNFIKSLESEGYTLTKEKENDKISQKDPK